jgi:hypothetical protein
LGKSYGRKELEIHHITNPRPLAAILKNHQTLKISNKVTKQLGTLIAGDTQTAPYLTGPNLVDFYNRVLSKVILHQD